MQIEVPDNPNCPGTGQFVYQELGPPRRVVGLVADIGGGESKCDVTGVTSDEKFVEAWAVKIADSGAGYAWLIYGSAWGIRLRMDAQPWSLDDETQMGEPFKIYGSEEDIIYAL